LQRYRTQFSKVEKVVWTQRIINEITSQAAGNVVKWQDVAPLLTYEGKLYGQTKKQFDQPKNTAAKLFRCRKRRSPWIKFLNISSLNLKI
jgi:hypothetical protein